MRRPLVLIWLLFSIGCYAQSETDSLERELAGAVADTAKIKLLLTLAEINQYEEPGKAEAYVRQALSSASAMADRKYEVQCLNRYAELLSNRSAGDSSIIFFEKALDLAGRITDATGKSAALTGLGGAYLGQGNLEKAEKYFREHISHNRESGNPAGVAGSYNYLGNIHNERGEYAQAMEAYTNAARINSANGFERDAGINMANIGMIHQKLGNSEMALDYFAKSDSLFKKFDFPLGQAFVMKNMGIVLRSQGRYDQALTSYGKALEHYEKMDQKREMSQTLQNMGNVYSDQGESARAIAQYRRSLNLATAISDSINMAQASQSLGQEFLYLNRPDSTENYSKKAVEIAIRTGADLTAMDGYKTLAEAHYARNNYQKAYDYRLQYEIYRDSLYTIEKRDLAEDIEARYQNEQKTKEIALLASEKELQSLQLRQRRNERNGIIALSVFILFLAGLSYNQYRIKRKANWELQELDRAKSNFFANISHEFRTPLTLIKGPMDRLAQQPDGSLSRQEVKMIRANTQRVLGLINQLLDLSKIDKGKLGLKTTEGDVFKCLRTASVSFDSQAAQRQIDYRVRIPAEPLWSAFDRDKLEKIAYNLLSNAFKFGEDGGHIVFEADFAKELVIRISNTGRGIAADQLPFIFDRFFQVEDGLVRNQEGTGIGLALTRDLVDLMGGTITVRSDINRVTTFEVHLPLQKIQAGVPDNLEPDPELLPVGAPDNYDFPPADMRDLPTVLLVEDNPDMRQYIKKELVEKFRILEATNGESGFKIASAKSPDLIITDLMMPKMDGIELCKRIKTQLETSHIPLIMLTARAGIDNKLAGLESRADDYLTKPFDARELVVRAGNLIAQRRQLQEYYKLNDFTLSPERTTTTSLDKKFLQQVLELLEREHANPEFGVSDMQHALAMSKTQLNRKLKALTGESPRDILRSFRLKRAAQLLVQKADTVTQIAYQVGFNNLSYFAKCFKKQYGVSPSSY